MKFVTYFLTRILVFNFTLSLLCLAYAEGMNVKSGLWETKSIVTMPFGGGKQEHTSQDCITQSNITPEEMMKDAEGCQILNANVDANSMQWTISCQNEGVEMLGEGSAESAGTTITGGMNISATFDGQDMVMSTNWEGKYIGDCN